MGGIIITVAMPVDLTPTMGAVVFNPNDRARVRTFALSSNWYVFLYHSSLIIILLATYMYVYTIMS